jgi:phosphoribosylamine--glycine ligase/phosphoribosylglycinamide formyltransferase/phosphoribosylformylglycinamidine cyclo-ligase
VKVAVLGGGGREQAIAYACRAHGHDVTLATALEAVLAAGAPDLVIVGPEALLADGVADRCAAEGIACFGPTAALAQLETSKGFTRSLAERLGIPSPAFSRHTSAADALAWWRGNGGREMVVKLDGLAAGKGVIVPASAAATQAAIEELGAQGPIVLEEALRGPECSLLALCDGKMARPLPLAQDHKRIGEGDTGPNTGGMGAYAPAPVPYDAEALTKTFVQPVIDHFAALGTPYVGVLYAGLMITAEGPKLLEFNCRFGDPEAQAVLALLETDLATLALACTRGRLAEHAVTVRPGSACTVVAAAPGYPGAVTAGAPITVAGATADLASTLDLTDHLIGTASPERRFRAPGQAVGAASVVLHPSGVGADGAVAGGRVLSVTATGPDLAAARQLAYDGMALVAFDGMQVRRDIGWRALGATVASYASTGVDIDEGNRAVSSLKHDVEATHGPAVLRGVGSFGGAFSAKAIAAMDDPVLVASTDGVGTKVELAARAGRYRGVGMDIVNHCIDDVLVQGARPLFFLDYIASSHIKAEMIAEVVGGMAAACAASGCALLGGETAEMPGVYAPGAFDIAGTLVGVVDRKDLLPSRPIEPGDTLVGIASNGPHTNGYSLLRKLFDWLPLDAQPAPLDRPLVDALLEPHRAYLELLTPVLATNHVKALAHITGGGLPENLPRVLPAGTAARIQLGSWPLPPLFQLVTEVATAMPTEELYRTLNMGVGMVVVTDRPDEVQALIGEPTWVIGEVTTGDRHVELVPT